MWSSADEDVPGACSMNDSCIYQIRIEGHLSQNWRDWFDGLVIECLPAGETTLTGRLADQTALLGVLGKIHALNLRLITVARLTVAAAPGF